MGWPGLSLWVLGNVENGVRGIGDLEKGDVFGRHVLEGMYSMKKSMESLAVRDSGILREGVVNINPVKDKSTVAFVCWKDRDVSIEPERM